MFRADLDIPIWWQGSKSTFLRRLKKAEELGLSGYEISRLRDYMLSNPFAEANQYDTMLQKELAKKNQGQLEEKDVRERQYLAQQESQRAAQVLAQEQAAREQEALQARLAGFKEQEHQRALAEERARAQGEIESKHQERMRADSAKAERLLAEREQQAMEQLRAQAQREAQEAQVSAQAMAREQAQRESREQMPQHPRAQAPEPRAHIPDEERKVLQESQSGGLQDEHARLGSIQDQSQQAASTMAEAMERARVFAAMPNAAPHKPRAHDPNNPSSHVHMDPERDRLSAEIMNRADHILRTPPLPTPNLQDRFEFPNDNDLQPLMMARTYGVQNPHYERALRQSTLSHQQFPEAVQRYMNPYQQHVVNRIAEEGNRNLFENILPHVEARYIKLGQHGGKRHHDLGVRAIRDIQKEISALQAQALASGYDNAASHFNTDMARHIEASKMHTALGQQNQASRLADMAALREAEQESRGFRQNLKDFQQHERERVHKHPQESLNAYSQLAQGNPYSTSTHHYKPSVPQSAHRRDYQNYAMSAGVPFLANMARGLFQDR